MGDQLETRLELFAACHVRFSSPGTETGRRHCTLFADLRRAWIIREGSSCFSQPPFRYNAAPLRDTPLRLPTKLRWQPKSQGYLGVCVCVFVFRPGRSSSGRHGPRRCRKKRRIVGASWSILQCGIFLASHRWAMCLQSWRPCE